MRDSWLLIKKKVQPTKANSIFVARSKKQWYVPKTNETIRIGQRDNREIKDQQTIQGKQTIRKIQETLRLNECQVVFLILPSASI